MSDLIWLSEAQMRRILPHFPLSYGVPRIVSGIIFAIRNVPRWRDAPAEYAPPKTIYNRFIRWSRLGASDKIFAVLAAKGGKPDQLMIDATYLKAHWTAASLLKRGCSPTHRRRQRRPESKLHAVCDGKGRPLVMLLSEGQMSDKDATLMIDALPSAKTMRGDKGYDADWFRAALANPKITACIP